jgi:hypothetical protein
MFQPTIQDVLALAEAGTRREAVLECVRVRLSSFECFEGAELLARTGAGLRRFTVTPGLGAVGPVALAALGEETTLRVDTAADLKSLGLPIEPGLTSVLILGIGFQGASAAAIVLGHSRAWSFAGAPLSRIRTIGQVALRLLLAGAGAGAGTVSDSGEDAALQADIIRLRAQISSLESEIAGLRAGRKKKH